MNKVGHRKLSHLTQPYLPYCLRRPNDVNCTGRQHYSPVPTKMGQVNEVCAFLRKNRSWSFCEFLSVSTNILRNKDWHAFLMYGTSKSLWSSTSRTSEVVLSNQNASNLNLHLWKLINMKPQNWGSANIMSQYYHDAFPCCKWTFSGSAIPVPSLAPLREVLQEWGLWPVQQHAHQQTAKQLKRTQTTSFWIWHVCVIPISMADLLVRLLMTHLLNDGWIEILLDHE